MFFFVFLLMRPKISRSLEEGFRTFFESLNYFLLTGPKIRREISFLKKCFCLVRGTGLSSQIYHCEKEEAVLWIDTYRWKNWILLNLMDSQTTREATLWSYHSHKFDRTRVTTLQWDELPIGYDLIKIRQEINVHYLS